MLILPVNAFGHLHLDLEPVFTIRHAKQVGVLLHKIWQSIAWFMFQNVLELTVSLSVNILGLIVLKFFVFLLVAQPVFSSSIEEIWSS